MTDHKSIPTYTKVGIRLTVVVALILFAMILKNCTGAVYYGATTDQATIQAYYDAGFTAGARQARSGVGKSTQEKEEEIDNPVLRKARSRGFREGWDSVQGQ